MESDGAEPSRNPELPKQRSAQDSSAKPTHTLTVNQLRYVLMFSAKALALPCLRDGVSLAVPTQSGQPLPRVRSMADRQEWSRRVCLRVEKLHHCAVEDD
jgi:hypothetical protein